VSAGVCVQRLQSKGKGNVINLHRTVRCCTIIVITKAHHPW